MWLIAANAECSNEVQLIISARLLMSVHTVYLAIIQRTQIQSHQMSPAPKLRMSTCIMRVRIFSTILLTFQILSYVFYKVMCFRAIKDDLYLVLDHNDSKTLTLLECRPHLLADGIFSPLPRVSRCTALSKDLLGIEPALNQIASRYFIRSQKLRSYSSDRALSL